MPNDLSALSRTLRQHDCELLRQVRETDYSVKYAGRMINVPITVREYFPRAIARRTAELSVQPRQRAFEYEYVAGRSEFLNAARNLVELHHTNLVRVFSAFEENNTAYMVERHQPARTFVDYCRGSVGVSEDDLLDILRPLLSALVQIHQRGFIHSDIRPENILVLPDKSTILTDFDFGVARRFESTGIVRKVETHRYMAPEQVSGSHYEGTSADIYSLGATLYHAIAGREPPDPESRIEEVLRGRSSDIESVLRTLEGRYSEPFLRALAAALRLYPAARLSARDWLGAHLKTAAASTC